MKAGLLFLVGMKDVWLFLDGMKAVQYRIFDLGRQIVDIQVLFGCVQAVLGYFQDQAVGIHLFVSGFQMLSELRAEIQILAAVDSALAAGFHALAVLAQPCPVGAQLWGIGRRAPVGVQALAACTQTLAVGSEA